MTYKLNYGIHSVCYCYLSMNYIAMKILQHSSILMLSVNTLLQCSRLASSPGPLVCVVRGLGMRLRLYHGNMLIIKSQDGDKSLIQNIVKNHICSGRIYWENIYIQWSDMTGNWAEESVDSWYVESTLKHKTKQCPFNFLLLFLLLSAHCTLL